MPPRRRWPQVAELQAELAPLFAAGDYQAALTRLAALREPVDTFFNEVMVMADDEALRPTVWRC